jgi:hypothetical protein
MIFHISVSEELIENGTTHIKLIEAMKKEFKVIVGNTN